jgi:nitrogen fixation protein NifU and related proteins
MALDDLYQEILFDHYKSPRNKGTLAQPDIRLELKNPFCGDQIILYLKFNDDRVCDVAFEGEGCVISQASASLMTEKIRGLTIGQVQELVVRFADMVKNDPDKDAIHLAEEDELNAFRGVCEFPTRVKCALLAWRTLEQALEKFKKDRN